MNRPTLTRALCFSCAFALAALWSCGAGTTSAFDALPEASRATYDRCWEHIRVPYCGAASGMADTINCARSASNTYAAHATQAERDAWLTARGCPQPVVSSGGQR